MSVGLASETDELPEPDFNTILFRVLGEVFLATAHLKPKERAPAALRLFAEIMAAEDGLSHVLPLRRTARQAAHAREWHKAMAVFAELFPVFLARLPK